MISTRRDLLLTASMTMLAVSFASPAAAQTTIANGGQVNATISTPGEVDQFRFTVTAAGNALLQIADTTRNDLFPRIEVFLPNGESLTSCSGDEIASCELQLPVTGTYTFRVSDYVGGKGFGATPTTGSYSVYFARNGAAEGGALVNGGVISGAIDLGDIDSFSLSLRSNEQIQIRLADEAFNGFQPRLLLLAPNGEIEADSSAQDVASISKSVERGAGIYTLLVVDSNYRGSGTSSAYKLYHARSGANEGGTLALQGSVAGTIDRGDLDSFTMPLAVGQTVKMHVADLARGDLTPRIVVIDSTGAVRSDSNNLDTATISFTAVASGTHTFIVSDASIDQDGPAATGNYELHVARVPGAKEAALANATTVAGVITMGDIDAFTFTSKANENILVRCAAVSDDTFVPYFEIYDPAGLYVASSTFDSSVARYAGVTAKTGIYTLLLYDFAARGGPNANYNLHFVHAPGTAESGMLASDAFVAGAIDKGDIDSFNFTASAGQNIALQVADTSRNAFSPSVSIYGPNGALLVEDTQRDLATVDIDLPTTGTYLAVLRDGSTTFGATGSYDLYFSKSAGANEGGPLTNGSVVAERIDRGDIDTYTFTATVGGTWLLRVVDTSMSAFVPRLEVFGPNGKLLSGPDSGADSATVVATIAQSGTHVVRVSDGSATRANTGNYNLHVAGFPGAAANGVLYNGVVKPGALDKGDLDSYSFSGTAGQVARIEVAKTSTGGFYPGTVIFDTTGRPVAQSTPELNPLDYRLPRSGTYWVLVFDPAYGATPGVGSYTLKLTGSGAIAPL